MDTLKKLTLRFKSGEALTSESLNSIVTAINKTNDTINNILKSYCDINQETGQQIAYCLGTAISLVPESRRSFTMKIRFIENIDMVGDVPTNLRYVEYFYTGPKSFDNETWLSETSWTKNVPNIIDGGTW